MSTAFITWLCIVSLTGLMLLACLCGAAVRHLRGHHVFGIGTEREEFFIPGDRLTPDDHDYDDPDDF